MLAAGAITGTAILSAWCAAGLASERTTCRLLDAIPVRVLVGGGRGKSSLVKLVHAALRAEGLAPLGRVTGDHPIFLLPDGTPEDVHRPGLANVRELRAAVRRATQCRANALVFENMAVRPDLQRLVAHRLVRPTLALFAANARDHLEEMPADDTARARLFLDAIPTSVPILAPPNDATYRDAAQAIGHTLIPAFVPSGAETLRPFMADLLAVAEAAAAHALGRPLGDATHALLLHQARALQEPRAFVVNGHRWVDLLSVNDPVSTTRWLAELSDNQLSRISVVYVHRRDRLPRLVDFAALLQSLHDYRIVGDPAPLARLGLDPRRHAGHDIARAAEVPTLDELPVCCIGNSGGAGATLRAWLASQGEAASC